MSIVDLVVRVAGREDLPAIVAIQNEVALHSTARLATTAAQPEDQAEWFQQFSTTGSHQMVVASAGGFLVGYACSQRYQPPNAYDRTVEMSVALTPSGRNRGIGSALYEALFARLDSESAHTALAGIVLPNDASVALHRKFGFAEVGVFRDYVIKNDVYLSSLWMQKMLD
jgi:phosphinothricin acetyltransferase